MHFHILTLFPEMVMDGLHTSITGRAVKNGHITIDATNIRDFAGNKHGHVDDYPYGGGAGMVMQPGPVFDAYQHVCDKIQNRKSAGMNLKPEDEKKVRVVYMTPQGTVFNQSLAEDLAKEEDLILLCGHYEGIDERVLDRIVTDHISIGDYVLTGGELPAMVVIDAVSRLVPGVLNNDVSAEFETFHDHLLEYPQYTRPEEFMGEKVPAVLLSGHHKNIEAWRYEQSVMRTKERRPDLWELHDKRNKKDQ
ncbi:MAG: tRNA (guanosine(37)-N1)-methyltransferase TrmD [Eubacteriales bacterium]|nr:tRNA (guanosine(37)-N1)-methyltransferase TrmD [Eubacteriales bacterium]